MEPKSSTAKLFTHYYLKMFFKIASHKHMGVHAFCKKHEADRKKIKLEWTTSLPRITLRENACTEI